jgi:UDP:flavonoid glycosyltransferase YjiC (YdhE family)
MRILFGSWPAYGHLLPMMPMVRAGQQGGHDIMVSSGADITALISQAGVSAHASGVTLAESYARMPGHATISELPAAEQLGFAARHLFGAGAVDRARDVVDLIQTWPPDLVVHETFELGTATAAVLQGIPHLTHGYGPMMPQRSYFLRAVGSAIADTGLPDPVPDVFAAPYLDICPPSLRGCEPSPWTTLYPLQPSAGEVDPDATLPPQFAALPPSGTVYVTLGTIMNQNLPVFRAVIDGCARWTVNVVLTTGPGVDPELLGPPRPAVLTASFLPQAAILPHCRVVVSHAGAGTMLGALCHGLPQLCLPQGTDQPSNTAALLPTGAALALQPNEITPDRVADALGRLLHETAYRQAAHRVRAEIDHMPAPSTVLHKRLPYRDRSRRHQTLIPRSPANRIGVQSSPVG